MRKLLLAIITLCCLPMGLAAQNFPDYGPCKKYKKPKNREELKKFKDCKKKQKELFDKGVKDSKILRQYNASKEWAVRMTPPPECKPTKTKKCPKKKGAGKGSKNSKAPAKANNRRGKTSQQKKRQQR